MNPYKILGITDQATDEEVKRAYLAMAKKYHPDAGGDAWVFAQVREAYDQVLKFRQKSNSTAARKTTTPEAAAPQAYQSAQKKSQYQSTQYQSGPHQSSKFTSQTAANAEPQSIVSRIFTLLFRQQLPLQSETNYFILVNVLDIVFTNVLLRMHAMEANPIANYILIHWGFHGMIAFKLVLVACVCIITQLIALQHLRRARQTLYFGTAIVGAVVVYSAVLLSRSHQFAF